MQILVNPELSTLCYIRETFGIHLKGGFWVFCHSPGTGHWALGTVFPGPQVLKSGGASGEWIWSLLSPSSSLFVLLYVLSRTHIYILERKVFFWNEPRRRGTGGWSFSCLMWGGDYVSLVGYSFCSSGV